MVILVIVGFYVINGVVEIYLGLVKILFFLEFVEFLF